MKRSDVRQMLRESCCCGAEIESPNPADLFSFGAQHSVCRQAWARRTDSGRSLPDNGTRKRHADPITNGRSEP